MKVTIAFGYNRVIVPYSWDQTVNQLMVQAAERYKKLLSKPCRIHKLETRDGALLCGDDMLKDVIEDKEILVAVFDDFDELEEDDTVEEFSSNKKPPYNHPRLAGDASLGLSPIHQGSSTRIQDEPATSSPMTSLLQDNHLPFQRGGKNRSTASRLSSDIDLEKIRDEKDNDEGFYSDAQIAEYYQQSQVLSLRGSTNELGVSLVNWCSNADEGLVIGLKVESVEPGSIADMEEYFSPGDGILEVDSITLTLGSFSNRCNLFNSATHRKKFLVRIVPRNKIEEIESLDNKSISESENYRFQAVQSVLKSNSRQVGEIIFVEILKQNSGLGFTLTSRDIQSAGKSPMLVNRITANGASSLTDLQIGDRLLAINNEEVIDKTQNEVVQQLKSLKVGKLVTLKLSRWSYQEQKHTREEVHNIDIELKGVSGLGLQLKSPTNCDCSGLIIENIIQNGAAEKDGRLKIDDEILAINNVELAGVNAEDALKVVRQILNPDVLKTKNYVQLKVGRGRVSEPGLSTPTQSSNISSRKERTVTKKKDSIRHNDSYIIATQYGIEKFPIDAKINRSQSLKALQYLNAQNSDASVLYKDYSLQTEEDGTGFDRESSSRQSFSEKRKPTSVSPPVAAKLIEYRSLNRKKNEQRRNSGGSTGVHSRIDSVTDSFSSSQNSSQDNSRTSKDQVCSPKQKKTLSPISKTIQQRGNERVPRGPVRSKSSDRIFPFATTRPKGTTETTSSTSRISNSAEKTFQCLNERDQRKYDQIRQATLEFRRKIDSAQTRGRISFNNYEPGQFRVTGQIINDERFGSLTRITTRKKYHSPGTVSCQEFHQVATPIISKPFLTPGQQTNDSTRQQSTVNRRIQYDSNPHISAPSISRSKVI